MTNVFCTAFLMAAAHKTEGITLSEQDAKIILKYVGTDDRHLLVDDRELTMFVRDVRKGYRNSTTKRVSFKEVVALAMDACKVLIDYQLGVKDEAGRIGSICENWKDLNELNRLYVKQTV